MRKSMLLWTAAVVVPALIMLVAIPLSQRLDPADSERADLLALGVASLIGAGLVWRATGPAWIARIVAAAAYLVVLIPILVLGGMLFACLMFPRCG